MNTPALLGILAMIPTAIGPLPTDARSLTLGTCFGATITIPLGDGKGQPDPMDDCHKQGCHAGNCREKQPKNKRLPAA